MLRSRMVAFIRRNEKIITLKYVRETGRITMRGADISPSNARRLADIGLNIVGELRLITEALVDSHNATAVTDGPDGTKVYTWKIASIFDPVPRLEIILH